MDEDTHCLYRVPRQTLRYLSATRLPPQLTALNEQPITGGAKLFQMSHSNYWKRYDLDPDPDKRISAWGYIKPVLGCDRRHCGDARITGRIALCSLLDNKEVRFTTSSMEDTTPKPWMDKAWLQKMIRDVEKDKYLLVTEHCVKSMGEKGDNYLSVMQRINARIRWSDNTEGEIFMVVKNIPPGKEMQKTLMASTAFPNEIKIFSKILPKFQAILNKAAPDKFPPFAARYICSEENETRFLIVEDLAAEGFRMAKRQSGLDMDHCILLMKTLGRYHATSVALHEVNPSIVESFKENMFTEESSKEFVCNFTKMTVESISKMVRTWPECGERMAGKLELISSVFHNIVKEQFKLEGNRLNVLTHGDLWVNNILFRYDGQTGAVQDVQLVDFQMSRYASFAMDLQYFINTSPTDAVRTRHVEDLLKEYHKELSNTLHLLGQGHRTISFHDVVEEYEKKNVFGFLMSLLILPIIQADPEDAADFEAILGGNDESSGMCSRAGNTEFIKVMKRILPIGEDRGYF